MCVARDPILFVRESMKSKREKKLRGYYFLYFFM